MSVICITTGVPGSGKTYVRCARFLVDQFLPNQSGVHYSNFPVNRDVCAEFVHKKITRRSVFSRFFYRFLKHLTVDDIKKRIQIIPYDVIQSWRREESGPWDYFNGIDLKYSHIAIDEVHEVISTTSSSEYVKKWDDFLGTVRHRGCVFEGITQDFAKVNRVFTGRASIRYELCPAEDLRDPFFSIRVMDWYELKAGLTGEFHKTVFQVEKRKGASGRWSVNHSERYLILPEYFKFYNSYNASLQEFELNPGVIGIPPYPFSERTEVDFSDNGKSDDRTPLYEYEKRSKIGIIAWFLHRNWWNLLSRLLIAGLVIWLCFFGGLSFLITHFVGFLVTNTEQKGKTEIFASAVPGETVPGETVPGETSPGETSSGETSPVETVPGETVPGETSPGETVPGETSLGGIEKVDPYKIVLLDFNRVVFHNGLMIGRGEPFPETSRYRGLYVSKFDIRKRCVSLSDGFTVLWMRPFIED